MALVVAVAGWLGGAGAALAQDADPTTTPDPTTPPDPTTTPDPTSPTTAAGGGDAVPAVAAVVAADPAAPPEVQVAAFWVQPGAGATATASVAFPQLEATPEAPWRVAVSVGDPAGQRARSSLISVGATVSGLAEVGDGIAWEGRGEIPVAVEGGVVQLGLDLAGLAPGGAVWVEAEITVDGEIVAVATPLVAAADLVDRPAAAPTTTAPWARVVDGALADAVRLDGPGPTVATLGRALEVTTTAPAPTEVAGQAVSSVIDTVVLAEDAEDGTPGATRRGEVDIDRTTGEVRLVAPDGEVVGSGADAPWLASGPLPGDPGAPGTVTLDLEPLDAALGGPVLDPATARAGVTRTVTLDDGTVLVADGALGTLAAIDEVAAAPGPPATEPTAPAGAEGDGSTVWLAIGIAVAAIALTVLVVGLRRQREGAGAPPPVAPAAPPAPVVAAPVPARTSSPPEPVVSGAPRPAPTPGAGRGADVGTSPRAPEGVGPAAPAPAHDPLAAFLAEVEALSARVDRLGSNGGAAPSEADEGAGGGRADRR